MMGSGFLSEAVMDNANTKMEAAIEDLRIKYEKIRAEEAKEKDAKESADRAAAAAEEAKREKDWVMTEDVDLEKIRQERIAALKGTAEARRTHREAGNGDLREIVEDEFLRDVTSAAFVVVHFFHPEFETCKVMDKHLRVVAARALQTKFLRINATKSAFFVAKLRVKTLPTLIYFKDGVAIGRQVGFEGLHITTTAPSGIGSLPASTAHSTASSTAAASTDFSTGSLARAMRKAGAFGALSIVGAGEDEEDTDDDEGDGGGERAGGLRGGATGGAGRVAPAKADPLAALAAARQQMLAELEDADI